MRSKILRDLFIVLAVFGLVWIGISMLKPKPNIPSIRLSVEDEEQLGDALTSALFTDVKLDSFPYLDTTLTSITYRLTEAIDSPVYNFKFHVIHNNEINAFATLGGHIYVFTGLLKVLESPEQLAAVIAHEMGHVQERHVVDKLVREYGLSMLFSLIAVGDPTLFAEIMQYTISGAFSRSQEAEADDFGLVLLENAKIEPKALAEAFGILKEEGGNSYVPAFLQSHPNIDSRIANAEKYELPSQFESRPFDTNWQTLVDELEENKL